MLATVPNGQAQNFNPSPEAAALGDACADLSANVSGFIMKLHHEAAKLRNEGATEDDPRVQKLAEDFAFVESVVTVTARLFTGHWTSLRTGRV